MSELGSIFNPGEAEMAQHLQSEKVLPAPSPNADAPPLETEDGDEVYIPALPLALGWAMPPQPPVVRRPEDLDEAPEPEDARRTA